MRIGLDGFTGDGVGVAPLANGPIFKFVVQAAAPNCDVVGLLDKSDKGFESFEQLMFASETRTLRIPGTVVGNEQKVFCAIKTCDRIGSPYIDMHHLSWLLSVSLGWVPCYFDKSPCDRAYGADCLELGPDLCRCEFHSSGRIQKLEHVLKPQMSEAAMPLPYGVVKVNCGCNDFP